MKKLIVLVLIGLMANVAYADGWRGGERWHGEGWHGGDRWGWALGAGLVGGFIGSVLVPRAPVYVQPAPVIAPPVYVQPAPQVYVQPGYYPAYPAPYYYYR